jgi:hypothetical protein
MSPNKSPSLEDYYVDGVSPKPPDKRRRNRFWILIGILASVVLILGAVNLSQSYTTNLLNSTGALQGTVVDENGDSVEAQIYILGTNIQGRAGQDGRFYLDSIPVGRHAVVVAYRGSGEEYTVSVRPDQTAQLGELRFVSTLEPRP